MTSPAKPRRGARTTRTFSADLSIPSPFSFRHKVGRYVWGWTWLLLFRPSPQFAYGWRRFLLRLYGADIASNAIVHRSVKIWAPWNLTMAPHSCLGKQVDCYSGHRIELGYRSVISQYTILCGASHDYEADDMPGFQRPIIVGPHAWVAADAYVGPGVTIGEGAVVGARAAVFKDVPAWTVVGGNPARAIKPRHWRPPTSLSAK